MFRPLSFLIVLLFMIVDATADSLSKDLRKELEAVLDNEEQDLFLFRQALHNAGILPSNSEDKDDDVQVLGALEQVTVFAPVNSVFQTDQVFLPISWYNAHATSWYGHLRHLILNQFVALGSFSKEDILSGSVGGALRTMESKVVLIDQVQDTVGGVTFAVEKEAAGPALGEDGVVVAVHPMNGFFLQEMGGWIDQTLWELVQNSPSLVLLKRYLSIAEASPRLLSALNDFSETGLTLLAPSDDAMGNEVLDEEILLYNLIPTNLYSLPESRECITLKTSHPLGIEAFLHRNQTLFANQEMARNGMMFVTKSLLKPPTLRELLSDELCLPEFSFCYKVLEATGWLDKLPESNFTVLCPEPPDSCSQHYSNYNSGYHMCHILEKLLLPEWRRHLDYFANHMVVRGNTTEAYQGQSEASMIVQAVNGIAFLQHQPAWGFETIYYLLKNSGHLTNVQHGHLCGNYDANRDIDQNHREGPITFFAPPSLPHPFLPSTPHRSYIVEGNFFMDDLLELDGRSLTSISGHTFVVSVLGDKVYLQSSNGGAPVMVGTGPNTTDILVTSESLSSLLHLCRTWYIFYTNETETQGSKFKFP